MTVENFGIAGLSFAGQEPPGPPILLVEGGEKVGKSTTILSLINWPRQGNQPLVLAFDDAGVDSIAQMGYPVACVKISKQPGLTKWDKTKSAITQIENAFRSPKANFPFTSIAIDCGSTMTDMFFREASKGMTSAGEKLQAYGAVLEQSREVMWRLYEIGVPTIWLCWLKEAYTETTKGSKKFVLGGPLMTGNFKALLAGRASQILYLEKQKLGVTAAGADAQGYVRLFHTRTYNNVEAGGRYSQYLPEPCTANLGWILTQIMTMGKGYAPEPAAPAAQ